MSGKYFSDAELLEMYGQLECELCGERLDDEVAEMYNPKVPVDSVICHGQCGIDNGLEVA